MNSCLYIMRVASIFINVPKRNTKVIQLSYM